MDPITHIHKRTDMYIGNPRPIEQPPEWILVHNEGQEPSVQKREHMVYSDGLVRLLIEPLSNMIDNVWRSREHGIKCSKLVVDMPRDGKTVTFWNDGAGIPIRKSDAPSSAGVYIPELIFGHLLTSSNYDDTEERFTSGRNGVGVKLCNVFSKKFTVEISDMSEGKVYTQTWTDYMKNVSSPIIKQKKTLKHNSTKIVFEPDMAFFSDPSQPSLTQWPDEVYHLMGRMLHETAALVGVPVIWNGEKIVYKSLKEYVQRCLPIKTPTEMVEFRVDLGKKQSLDVVVCSSGTGQYHEMGFVNGMYTREGGIHTECVTHELFKAVVTRIQKTMKSESTDIISVKEIKSHFLVVVNAVLINPAFTNQNKTRLVSPPLKSVTIDPKYIQTITTKWESLKERIQECIRQKQLLSLKKTENKRRGSVKRIEGLDPANLAGSSRSDECTLILCEGLSAKTYAVQGLSVGWNGKKGRDNFGIYPLRGKLLNCQNASVSTITQNKEITDLIQALNLRHHVDYTKEENRKTLNYGNVLILTDSDVDGLHIASLILNAFHSLFPSLCTTHPPFLYWMMTPVAKVTIAGRETLTLFHDDEYQKTLEKYNDRKLKVKYFKGLGTCSTKEVGETFGQKVVSFEWDALSGESLKRAFLSTQSHERKTWMSTYNKDTYQTPDGTYPVTRFLDQELIRYSIDDCKRSLPSLFDGLKQSQRKILYAVMKKRLGSKSIKVAQLAGYVAEVSNYHHGEQCLYDTITKMAQDFVGSNNIPYLVRDGQFGSRTYLGKDSASARYTFTRPDVLTRLLFREDDDTLLSYPLDDGEVVEPEYYLPILPMILLNGCLAGIGTGWSCSVPCLHPLRVLHAVYTWLESEHIPEIDDPTWTPWYRYFQGVIRPKTTTKEKTGYVTEGILEAPGSWSCDDEYARHVMVDKTRKRQSKTAREWRIREIPVRESINRYKEFLEKLQEERKIKNLRNYSTADHPYFLFETVDEKYIPTIVSMRLTSEVSVSNLVLFTENHVLKKFESLRDIFIMYCEKRLCLYDTRLRNTIETLERQRERLENMLRFLHEVHADTIHVFRVPLCEIEKQLEDKKYTKCQQSSGRGYEYLTSLRISHFTRDKMSRLEQQIQHTRQQIHLLKTSTARDLWAFDLYRFCKVYQRQYPFGSTDSPEEEQCLTMMKHLEKKMSSFVQCFEDEHHEQDRQDEKDDTHED